MAFKLKVEEWRQVTPTYAIFFLPEVILASFQWCLCSAACAIHLCTCMKPSPSQPPSQLAEWGRGSGNGSEYGWKEREAQNSFPKWAIWNSQLSSQYGRVTWLWFLAVSTIWSHNRRHWCPCLCRDTWPVLIGYPCICGQTESICRDHQLGHIFSRQETKKQREDGRNIWSQVSLDKPIEELWKFIYIYIYSYLFKESRFRRLLWFRRPGEIKPSHPGTAKWTRASMHLLWPGQCTWRKPSTISAKRNLLDWAAAK